MAIQQSLSANRRQCLFPPPLDGAPKPDRLAVFGDGSPGQVKALAFQQIDQRIVAEDRLGILDIDQRFDPSLSPARRATSKEAVGPQPNCWRDYLPDYLKKARRNWPLG